MSCLHQEVTMGNGKIRQLLQGFRTQWLRETKLNPSPPRKAVPAASQFSPAAIIQRARLDPSSLTPDAVLQLQRTIGNHAVGQLIKSLQDQNAQKKADSRATGDAPIQRLKVAYADSESDVDVLGEARDKVSTHSISAYGKNVAMVDGFKDTAGESASSAHGEWLALSSAFLLGKTPSGKNVRLWTERTPCDECEEKLKEAEKKSKKDIETVSLIEYYKGDEDAPYTMAAIYNAYGWYDDSKSIIGTYVKANKSPRVDFDLMHPTLARDVKKKV